MKAMAKSPYLRYETCRELMDDLKNYRPGENLAKASAEPSISTPPPPGTREKSIREKIDKNYFVEMPRIPGVEQRSTAPTPSRSKPIPPSGGAAGSSVRAETGQRGDGIYAGPTVKPDLGAAVKRLAKIGAGVVLAAILGSVAVKMIGRMQRPDSDVPPALQNSGSSSEPQSTEPASTQPDPAERPVYVTQSNPEVATVSELAQPWSSKKFFFRSLTLSRYVPALIIRLPGPASESKSYWAFSLEVPFSQCQFAYLDDVAKLSSEYGFEAAHPMVVNPCSRTIFNPLQLKELPGNILVRGAIVQGSDLRPPYGIEVKVRGNQIHAVAME
jgi:hypothetical protein